MYFMCLCLIFKKNIDGYDYYALATVQCGFNTAEKIPSAQNDFQTPRKKIVHFSYVKM